ncbi:MAG TPA: hypothetical protein VN607_02245 [Gemmatimonadaceae bacterium]|nr:hypothetical protein [Gemmatimonadaceae bacterium]
MTPLPTPADHARPTPAADFRQRGHRYVAGDVRTIGWCTTAHVCCPLGHDVRHGWVTIGETTRRCGYKHGSTECALLTWELWVPHAGLVLVAEIDRRDLEAIRTLTMPETLAYLGATMWPVPNRRKSA